MKSIIIVITLIFLILGSVSAQSSKSYGFRVGSNLSTAVGDLNDEMYAQGFMFGASLTFGIDDHLSFRPELCYSSKGYKYSVDSDPYFPNVVEITFKYLEIPVLLVYSMNKDINFIAGTYLEFFGRGNFEDNDYMTDPGYGLVFGFEYCTKYAMFGIRYSMGLSNIYDSFLSDLRHRVFQFTLGINVPLEKKEDKEK